MTDRQIDSLIAAADPVAEVHLADRGLTHAAAALRDAIICSADAPPRRAAPRRRRALALGLAVAAALAAGAFVGIDRLGGGAEPAWAAPVLRAAETSPRLLIGEEGWRITRAYEFGVDVGETEFSNGRETVQLNWYPADVREIERPHPGSGTTEVAPTTLAGAPVVIERYDGSDRYRAAWRRNGWTLELDGEPASPARFTEILHALQPVGVDEWLGAMPASVVRPGGRAAVVDAMLADIPLPSGFDVGALRSSDLVKDRYQLGAEVAGAVACAWIGRWVDARAAGDADRAREAADAMATSHNWTVLREMDAAGAYPEVLWEYADAMPTNADVAAGAPGVKVAGTYRGGLGCEAAP